MCVSTRMLTRTSIAIILFLLSASAPSALAQATAFTYQGGLIDGSSPADGMYDMQFKLFNLASGGTQQGSTITLGTVQVMNGIFSVSLDFGANVFTGADRFLEISLRPTGSAAARTVLAPRQPVTAAPYALRSASDPWLGMRTRQALTMPSSVAWPVGTTRPEATTQSSAQ